MKQPKRYPYLSSRIEVIRHRGQRMYAGEQRFDRFLASLTGWEHVRGATFILKRGKQRIRATYQKEGKVLVLQRLF